MKETIEAKSVFLIAAYNEASRIRPVVDKVCSSGYACVVVNDGSTDNTVEAILGTAAKVISHPLNLGQGAALATGFTFIQGMGFDYIVTYDADGQHRLEDARSMLEVARKTGVGVVLGSRFLGDSKNSEIPMLRRFVLRLGVFFTRVHTGLAVTDTHNGLRVIRNDILHELHPEQPRMAHASEILKLISKKRISWVEAPATIIYSKSSLLKGQKSIAGAVSILWDLLVRR